MRLTGEEATAQVVAVLDANAAEEEPESLTAAIIAERVGRPATSIQKVLRELVRGGRAYTTKIRGARHTTRSPSVFVYWRVSQNQHDILKRAWSLHAATHSK